MICSSLSGPNALAKIPFFKCGRGSCLLILGPPLPAAESDPGEGIYIHLGDFLGISECLLTVYAERSSARLGHSLPPSLEALWPDVGMRIEEMDLTNVSKVTWRKRLCILIPKENKLGF